MDSEVSSAIGVRNDFNAQRMPVNGTDAALIDATHHSSPSILHSNSNHNHIVSNNTNDYVNSDIGANPSYNQNFAAAPSMNLNESLGNTGSLRADNGQSNVSSRIDFFEEIRNGGGHWSQLLRQVILSKPPVSHPEDNKGLDAEQDDLHDNIPVPLRIAGGSENGQFAYIGELDSEINGWITVGYLQSGDIILNIHGQQVAGYTEADVLSLLYYCINNNSVTLTVAPKGSLGPDLRSYLNTRFQKGSVDHALQGVVRDNLYLRTVPVTTRKPRPGEINGVDYTFLSPDEFMELERNGSLLESGVYAGNHYGTPKPWAGHLKVVNHNISNGGESNLNTQESSKGTILPGIHPSSEGKRRRNRSNVEALGAFDEDEVKSSQPVNMNQRTDNASSNLQGNSNNSSNNNNNNSNPAASDELGPLPDNWEMSYTEKGEVYFIDHNTGTSHWLDPRLSKFQKLALEDCSDNELPYGWEKIEDPHYGTYYIDHVNRRTQFENPVIQAKQKIHKSKSDNDNDNTLNNNMMTEGNAIPNPLIRNEGHEGIRKNFEDKTVLLRGRRYNPNPIMTPPKPGANRNSLSRFKANEGMNPNGPMGPHFHLPPSGLNENSQERLDPKQQHKYFTRNPDQLTGERIFTTLTKSSRGLGFTIVGGDDDDGYDEFLQIKSVVTDGPAWRDGKLRTGDVLVRVNDVCVLGFTHQEMVSIFQSISPGEEVNLEVCRGYPLPFDPTDPNTEIVTTVAVAPLNPDNEDRRPATPDSLAQSAHSLPELSNDRFGYPRTNTGRPASVDLLMDSPPNMRSELVGKQMPMDSSNFMTVGISKGASGFGFTIADSVAGQKVKKVLDPIQCSGLEEGDRLVAIDGMDLRGLSHTQVVQVLKEYPLRREASLTIQRVNLVSSPKFSPVDLRQFEPKSNPNVSQMHRSKTPTADLTRSKPKLRDSLPERPRTPVIDSIGNLNPMFGLYHGENNSRSSHAIDQGTFFSEKLVSNSLESPRESVFSHLAMRDWIELVVELQRRQEGFGFRIVGGTEEGSQVSVGHIVPGGAAALDGRLRTNDQIISVDGESVVGASHHSVVQLMARSASAGRVTLTIRRPTQISPQSPTSPKLHMDPQFSTPMQVLLKRQSNEGFGFVIISSASKAGATIGKIVEGSPADRCGQIKVRDRILAVNQVDISQLHHSQVVQLIKDSGLTLSLSILPCRNLPGTENQSSPHQVSPRMNMVSTEFEREIKEPQASEINSGFPSDSRAMQYNSSVSSFQEAPGNVFLVELQRGNRGFGFSIRGGKEFQNMPLFVLRLAEGGPAVQDGRIQVGDQILEINGRSTQGMSHADAINLIRTGGASVGLLLRRGAVPYPYLSQPPISLGD